MTVWHFSCPLPSCWSKNSTFSRKPMPGPLQLSAIVTTLFYNYWHKKFSTDPGVSILGIKFLRHWHSMEGRYQVIFALPGGQYYCTSPTPVLSHIIPWAVQQQHDGKDILHWCSGCHWPPVSDEWRRHTQQWATGWDVGWGEAWPYFFSPYQSLSNTWQEF